MELTITISFYFSITSQPVAFTLKDAATAELQQRAEIPPLPPSAPDPQKQAEKPKNDTERPVKVVIQNATVGSDAEVKSDGELKPEIDRKGKENLTSSEEIPSFSEWAQKQLEEAERKKVQGNVSAQNQSVNGKQSSGGFCWRGSEDCWKEIGYSGRLSPTFTGCVRRVIFHFPVWFS